MKAERLEKKAGKARIRRKRPKGVTGSQEDKKGEWEERFFEIWGLLSSPKTKKKKGGEVSSGGGARREYPAR